jgi:hypothetical protein
MQFFFLASWKSAILMVAAAAVVSRCYGYDSFLLVYKYALFRNGIRVLCSIRVVCGFLP